MPKKGIPKKILDELDIRKVKKEVKEVTVVVERHQAKIPIPRTIREDLNLKKGQKCKLLFNEKKKELVCKF